ncbi:MAG: RagB/SusD family nutrient uptake outer membrane protein [Haliscomenobacter sp.]|nr:RagB/SusD family nutrient uptake outer membrane protein [Haliscomenobacter sp.]
MDGIVNSIRARAGLKPVSSVNLNMLLDERRKEFAGENLRWEDLVRTGKVVEVINAWRAKEDTGNKVQPMKNEFIIYPIPQDQLDVKKGLYTQNPGYL